MNATDHPFDIVVMGAGQAGLACGWHLKQQGLDFLIQDEQQQPGGNRRNYYDSLELLSPAAHSSLPGLPFPGEPEHYPSRDEVAHYLEHYTSFFQLPILSGDTGHKGGSGIRGGARYWLPMGSASLPGR